MIRHAERIEISTTPLILERGDEMIECNITIHPFPEEDIKTQVLNRLAGRKSVIYPIILKGENVFSDNRIVNESDIECKILIEGRAVIRQCIFEGASLFLPSKTKNVLCQNNIYREV